MTHNIHKPFRIAFLLIDAFPLMSYASAIEPLRAANQLSDTGFPLYQWQHITINGAQSQSSTGASIKGDCQVGDDLDVDLLFVVAGGDPFEFNDSKTFAWLRKLAARGMTIGGISGGPAILVRGGLMEGRRMTIHWEHANALQELSPNIALSKTLYVIDQNRITCAGGVAPLDLMHALIINHHGAEFARQVSDWFLHTDVRSPGGMQKASIIDKYNVHHPAILQAIETMENHIGNPLSLDAVASIANCTPRHLNRLFKQSLNMTTMTVYRNIRLDHALQLLSQTGLSLTDIALDVGFSSSAHFSSAFRAYYKKMPKDIRRGIAHKSV